MAPELFIPHQVMKMSSVSLRHSLLLSTGVQLLWLKLSVRKTYADAGSLVQNDHVQVKLNLSQFLSYLLLCRINLNLLIGMGLEHWQVTLNKGIPVMWGWFDS